MAQRFTRTVRGGDFYVEPNYKGIGEMIRDRSMWRGTEPVAKKMKLIAEALAPESKRKGHTGEYKRSFEVVNGIRVTPHPRAFSRLQNTSPHALAVEYGTVATRKRGKQPHRTLRKAARALKGA